MIDIRKPAVVPTWWDKFIEEVRSNGGRIGDARRTLELARDANNRVTVGDPTRTAELEQAVEDGRQRAKTATARQILERFAGGDTISAAAGAVGKNAAQVYRLISEAGLDDEFDEIRERRKALTDYGSGVAFLNQQLDLDAGVLDPDVDTDGLVLAYVATLRRVIGVIDKDFRELQGMGYVGLRNEILRQIGRNFDEEDGFPPFLASEE